MKGIISGIKRMEIHDGDGFRTTVFFKGCPLRCIWCHNPESISFAPQVAFFKNKCLSCGACRGERTSETAKACPTEALQLFGREFEVSQLVDYVCIDEPFFKNGGGVTLSGGECLGQPEFCIALAKAFHERKISVYIDTCGYAKREIIERIIPYTDKFLYDVKAIDTKIHRECTGRENTLILDNLRYICSVGCNVEIRYPLVKGYNEVECESIAKFLSGLGGITKIKVLQYHSYSASRYDALGMVNTLPKTETTFDDVENAVATFKKYGLPAVNGMNSD